MDGDGIFYLAPERKLPWDMQGRLCFLMSWSNWRRKLFRIPNSERENLAIFLENKLRDVEVGRLLRRPRIKIVSTIVRYLLEPLFMVFGLNGFLHFIHQPPPANPLPLQFIVAVGASHFAAFFFAVQLLGGLLLLPGVLCATCPDTACGGTLQHSCVPPDACHRASLRGWSPVCCRYWSSCKTEKASVAF